MKPSEASLRKLADEFKPYADLVKHPGWRDLVEKPLQAEIDWTEAMVRNVLDGGDIDNRINLPELKLYRRALHFVRDQVLLRIRMGEQAVGTLAARAEDLGLKEKEEITVPKFTEVK